MSKYRRWRRKNEQKNNGLIGPARVFHSANDVEKYCNMVYYSVNLNPRVPLCDKSDVAHTIILRLMKANKEINGTYIMLAVESEINYYLRQKISNIKKLKEVKKTAQRTTQLDFSEFDLYELPLSTEEIGELERYVFERGVDIAEEEGVTRFAISQRKRRLLEKLRKRLDEYWEIDYNE
jgi:hypothetical protein